MFSDETIVAISSAGGRAARMIVRVGGAGTREIVGRLGISEFVGGAADWMGIRFDGVVCPAWVYQFAGPRSYSGEDILELHIPGNPILGRMLFDWLLANGARAAEAGEFTARAFFNRKMDLAQAEGVAAIIAARGAEELSAARKLLAGELARRLKPMMELLADTLAMVEAGIDFSEEGIEFLSGAEISGRVERVRGEIEGLIAGSGRLERLTHEPTIVLAGRANAGKSTLINALAGMNRSVVSAEAGTTRDVLSVEIALSRGIVRLVDVAGIEEGERVVGESVDFVQVREPLTPALSPSTGRGGKREIEEQMRERAERAILGADVVVLVKDCLDERGDVGLPRSPDVRVSSKIDLDLESGPHPGPLPAYRERGQEEHPGRGLEARVLGEIDLGSERNPHSNPPPEYRGREQEEHWARGREGESRVVSVSAKSGVGLDLLREELGRLAFGSDAIGAALALSGRHVRLLEEARGALERASGVGNSLELLAAELRLGLDALGGILGVVTPDDVLGRVFATFCVGK